LHLKTDELNWENHTYQMIQTLYEASYAFRSLFHLVILTQ